MKIGIPKEIKIKENRVSCTPGGARELVRNGHEVWVEQGAGVGSGYADDLYVTAGARIVSSAEEAWSCEMVMKVKEPIAEEYQYFRKDLVLFTYLHLAAAPELTQALLDSGTTAIAYETISVGKRLPLLEPMSEIAGRMSTIVGAHYLNRSQGGKGVLLGGVPGVLPGNVLVLGGGTAGVNAGRMATGLGANVTILDVDLEKMRFLDISMDHAARTLYSNEQNLMELLPKVDLLIGAVLLPGAKAPKLIREEMLDIMENPSLHHKFVNTLDRIAPDARLFRKSGSWKNYHSDSILVWGENGRKYVLVALIEDAKGEQIIRSLVQPAEAALRKSVILPVDLEQEDEVVVRQDT